MERVHYRRVTGSAAGAGASSAHPARRAVDRESEEGGGGFKERLIVQAIASALILVMVMAICLLDYDITLSARRGLVQALGGQTTFNGLLADIQSYGETLLNRADEGAAAAVPETLPEEVIPADSITPAVTGGESKTTVPEPPVSPGP